MLTSVIRTVGLLLGRGSSATWGPRRASPKLRAGTAACSSHPREAVVRCVRALRTAHPRTECSRRAPHPTRERRAEASQAEVAHLEADLGHRQCALAQQHARPRHPRLALQRVRRRAEHGTEPAKKPGTRHPELASERAERKRLLAAIAQAHPQVAEAAPAHVPSTRGHLVPASASARSTASAALPARTMSVAASPRLESS